MKNKSIKGMIAMGVAGYALKKIATKLREKPSSHVDEKGVKQSGPMGAKDEIFNTIKSLAQKKWAETMVKADTYMKQS